MPGDGAVWPAIVRNGSLISMSSRPRSITPATSNTTMRGPWVSIASRSEPGPRGIEVRHADDLAAAAAGRVRCPALRARKRQRRRGLRARSRAMPASTMPATSQARRSGAHEPEILIDPPPSAAHDSSAQLSQMARVRDPVDFYTQAPERQDFVRSQLKMTPVSFIQQLTANLEWAVCGNAAEQQDQSMGGTDESIGETERADAIARQFVQARRDGLALRDFPGAIPPTLERCLSRSRTRRSAAGRTGSSAGRSATSRRNCASPPATSAWSVRSSPASCSLPNPGVSLDFPVFAGGFAAVEAELVFRLGADAPAGKIRLDTR